MADPARASDTPNLETLTRALEGRWRVRTLLGYSGTALLVSTAVSLAVALAAVVFRLPIPIGRIIGLLNGAAAVAALIRTGIERRTAQHLLADADRVYHTREVLSSAEEFSRTPGGNESPSETAFRRLVVVRAEELSPRIDPATVYPIAAPRTFAPVGAMIVALAVLLVLNASDLFARPSADLADQGLLLEQTGRRLAEQSENEDLQRLADEIRRLGERLRDGTIDAGEARQRIDKLAERVEEQVRNLERLGELATNQKMDIPPETEDALRSALRSGMTEGEVLDFFMSMRAEGDTLPDTLRALEEATPDRPPDANLNLDDERIRKLLDQLNLSSDSGSSTDVAQELDSARRNLQQAGIDVQKLSEGTDEELGQSGESGAPVQPGADDQKPDPGSDGEPGGQAGSGQQGGETPVADTMNDAFTGIDGSNPIFRQIEGIVGDGTIRDVIVRELPSDAISRLSDAEREVAFERVIEEAVQRENPPPELQQLIRNYFLRITLGSSEGVQHE